MADLRRCVRKCILRGSLALGLTLAAVLGLMPAPAQAATIHQYSSTFAAGEANGQALAVDQVSHDVYVLNQSAGTLARFTSAGAPDNFISGPNAGTNKITGLESPFEPKYAQVAVDNSGTVTQGDIYVAQPIGPDAILEFDSKGNPLGQLTSKGGAICGVATDPQGNVYAGSNNNQVFIYSHHNPVTDANFASTLNTPHLGYGICDVAADSAGSIYVAGWPGGPIDKFPPGSTTASPFAPASDAPYVDTSTNDLYVSEGNQIARFNSSGSLIETFGSGKLAGSWGVAVDPSTNTVYANASNGGIAVFKPIEVADVTTRAPSNTQPTGATLNGHIDPLAAGEVTNCYFEYVDDAHYNLGAADPYSEGPPPIPCAQSTPISAPTDASASLTGLTTDTTYHYRLVATDANGTSNGLDQTFTPRAVQELTTGEATDVTNHSARLTGSFLGEGIETTYYFEYGTSTKYGRVTGAQVNSGAGPQSLSADLGNLSPFTTIHYRVVASNAAGTTYGEDESVTTQDAPAIIALSFSHVTANSAELDAVINPRGPDTTYLFEYGTGPSYGSNAPASGVADLGSGMADKAVTVSLTNLQSVTYHFRLVAANEWGTTTSVDHTFSFYPPVCPNAHVRQQTVASLLPDCRAYELVSPEDAGGTSLFPGGPNTGLATNPSRMSYTGLFGTIPGSGSPINGIGDLYVATRTNSGWVSKYVGLPGDKVGCAGGPPATSLNNGPDTMAMGVLTTPGMNAFLDWDDGNTERCATSNFSDQNPNSPGSNAPYLWDANGQLLDHLPSNLNTVPSAVAALQCPYPTHGTIVGAGSPPDCSGDVSASADLTHFVFSSNRASFAPGGITGPPGSAYDDDTVDNTVTLISKTAAGADIPVESTNEDPAEFIRFRSVSTDGSRILMSTAATPACRGSNTLEDCPPLPAGRLYMRVDDAVTYEVSQGRDVSYVGSTADDSRVYFTSPEQLTPEDHDTSVDLYLWSEKGQEEGHPLTLISKGLNGEGNSDHCEASWTGGCGVVAYSSRSFSRRLGGRGGNGISDNSIAAENGDIYFYSPEQLDGLRGVTGQANLYDYRGGAVRYVTTLDPNPYCTEEVRAGKHLCSDGPIVRIQVSPNDSHMAFVTASQVTSYDNAGHLEMYSYEPATREITCDSCVPSGEPPKSDVQASQSGLFMTDDGRTFFSTSDALVAQDTNRISDVYEFVGGRPQLITPGTGTLGVTGTGGVAPEAGGLIGSSADPGFYGVSANGTDVYFSTYETLVGQDRNGNNLKFYDARTNGGFPFVPPPASCAAADECHGPGSVAPSTPTSGTGTDLGTGGNVSQASGKAAPRRTKHRHRRRARHTQHRKAGSSGRGPAR
jgi:hypothetical protein